MKRVLFTIVFALMASVAVAQTYQNRPEYGWRFKNVIVDSTLNLPRDTVMRSNLHVPGAIVYQLSDSSIYTWNGVKWSRIVSATQLKALDSARRSNDTLYFRRTSGGELAVKITGLPPENINGLPDSLGKRWDTIQFPTKVQYTILDKYLSEQNVPIQPGDSLVTAIGKLQAQINNSNTLQGVTNNGNSTTNTILANGGLQASSILSLGTTSPEIRMGSIVKIMGTTTGVGNVAGVEFRQSNNNRIGYVGDGSSYNSDLLIAGVNGSNIRTVLAKNDNKDSPYVYSMVWANDGKVHIGDTIPVYIRSNIFSVRGNMQVYNRSGRPAYTEFNQGDSLRMAVGYMEDQSAVLSNNMRDSAGYRKYYDSTRNALWLNLDAAGSGFSVRTAWKGQPHSIPTYDIWNNGGTRTLFRVDTGRNARVFNNLRVDSGLLVFASATSYQIDFRRSGFASNQGLAFRVGAGATMLNNYDSSNATYPAYIWNSTKGSTTKQTMYLDGNSGNLSIGASATPTATIDVNGSTGYNQLRLRNSYTPTSSADTNGNTGDVTWDANYFYIKTGSGWKRSALTTF